jgi:transcription antitermination factor NusG
VSEAEQAWFAVHTKPRCEKKLDGMLGRLGWEHYLPLVERRHRHGAVFRAYTKPLFTGYVFAKIPLEQKARLYQRQLVVRTIGVTDEGLFLRQLDAIRALVAAGVGLALRARLTRGARVRVKSGPLRGIEGVVENPGRNEGIVVSMDVIQQGVHVAVPMEDIEPLD